MQAKIIKEMCDFLLDSFAGESFTLISVKREAVGKEDSSISVKTLPKE